MPDDALRSPATLPALLAVFVRMGMVSFGGGLSGWMHREIVERRRWMSEERFLAALALGQVLPGPNSVNLALQIGLHLRGGIGAAAAGIGLLGPPFLVILALALLYGRYGGAALVNTALAGVAAAGIGLTCATGVRAARRMRGVGPFGIAAAVFVAVGVLKWPMVPVVLAVIPPSVALAWRSARQERERRGA
ncbi:chromate transporter [Caldovatus aquaticus]|uniref:Chromate transporter n=1 Tax=Caldovatus aquaticus TaxID=2865671 RepID=A0ABS7EZN0_9PROT|nr:chromate transporter [Caldovatus aquaticus]MBW8268832.1 chromate transporter [Caldovatus aquaticus]